MSKNTKTKQNKPIKLKEKNKNLKKKLKNVRLLGLEIRENEVFIQRLYFLTILKVLLSKQKEIQLGSSWHVTPDSP